MWDPEKAVRITFAVYVRAFLNGDNGAVLAGRAF